MASGWAATLPPSGRRLAAAEVVGGQPGASCAITTDGQESSTEIIGTS